MIGSVKSAPPRSAKKPGLPPTVKTFPRGTFFMIIVGQGREKNIPLPAVLLNRGPVGHDL